MVDTAGGVLEQPYAGGRSNGTNRGFDRLRELDVWELMLHGSVTDNQQRVQNSVRLVASRVVK